MLNFKDFTECYRFTDRFIPVHQCSSTLILLIEFYVDFIEVRDFVYSAVGADINAIDSQKQTPLDTAREGNFKVQIVQLDTLEVPVEETVSIPCI